MTRLEELRDIRTERNNHIEELQSEIKLLIKEKPRLGIIQKEIDQRLAKCNTQYERCRIIQEMMLNQWWKITEV